MGGGNYHADVRTARVAVSTSRTSDQAFNYNERARSGQVQGVHPDLNILNKTRESCESTEHPEITSIAVVMDVTKSRGDDARRIYEQVPSFLASLKLSNIVPDPQVLWAAVGDANCDRAPIQVGQFESDKRIDAVLEKIWMEEGGGGTGEESYELLAYYLANKTRLDSLKNGRKGFAFFTADEAPYPVVSRTFVKSLIGDTVAEDLPSTQVFAELQSKYHTAVIFPRSTMAQRKSSIDAEIRQRLKLAGGKFEKVSIRCSLIWDNRNDLDLHCMTPAGEHIFYGAKRARCGGELDVDRNVRGEDPKPVENIRWAVGEAQLGLYQFWVENYGYHERDHGPIPFRAELDIHGQIQRVEGVIRAGATGSASKQELFSFVYNGADVTEVDNHAAYQDEVILEKWSRYIPAVNILRVEDAASSVEVMIGFMALQSGAMTLDQFVADMKSRRVPEARQKDATLALTQFAKQGIFQEVSPELF